MKKTILTVGAAIATAALFGSPAFAVATLELPATDQMFIIDCDSHPGQIWKVTDSTTGAVEPFGTPADGADGCAYAGGYDPTTGFGHWVNGDEVSIGKFDVETGDAEIIDVAGDATDIWQLAVGSDGTAIMQPNTPPYDLHAIDLETGVTTALVNGSMGGVWGFLAFNPATDEFLYFVHVSGGIDVYTVDPTDGSQTPIGSILQADVPREDNPCGEDTGNNIDQFAIDSNGNYWIQMDGWMSDMFVYDANADVWSYNGYTHDATSELYPADNACGTSAFYQMGYVIAYDNGAADSGLADTGVDYGTLMGSIAAASVAIAIGAGMRRRNRV